MGIFASVKGHTFSLRLFHVGLHQTKPIFAMMLPSSSGQVNQNFPASGVRRRNTAIP
jgi:hypothetical protein